MKFTKMHGLGNTYIYVNLFEQQLAEEELSGLAERLADVNFGIGSDGMILIGPSERAHFRMRIFNADGSEGKNCGNGLRCVAKYVYEHKLTDHTAFTIETLGGIVDVKLLLDGDNVRSVAVNMGAPQLTKKDLPMQGEPDSRTVDEPVVINGTTYHMTGVSMGNPHTVMFVDDVDAVPITQIGPEIERASVFPERINVEFIRVRNRREIDFRVWERGSGVTLACGTGACAAVVAGILNGKLDRNVPVTVHLLGGDLEITWHENGNVYMTGPAQFIADGEFYK